MTSNVFSIWTGKRKPEPLEISEYSLTVGGELYRVRRAIKANTRCGFITITDSTRKPVLMFSASYPDEHIGQLIVGWRTGCRHGLERGRREISLESMT